MFTFLSNTTNNNWILDPELFDFLYGGRTDEEREAFIPAKIRKERVKNQYNLDDRYSSVFYKTYILPSLQDNAPINNVSTTIGRKFRRRFRVPFSVFLEICSSINATHNLPDEKFDARGQECVKLSLLVLGCLRILGSGCTFDAIEELTCVSQDTHRKFFHKYFCTWGQEAAKDLIKLPHDENTARHIMALYERKGLPGCVGSVDCVHICWDKCPSSLHSTCKGKTKCLRLLLRSRVLTPKRYCMCHNFSGGPTMIKQFPGLILYSVFYAMMMDF